MAGSRDRHRTRHESVLATVAAIAVLAGLPLAAGGCGGSDEADGSSDRAAATATTQNLDPEPRHPGAEEIGYVRALELGDKDNDTLGGGATEDGTVKESLEDIQVGIAEVNGSNVCHELSSRALLAMARISGSNDPDDLDACADTVRRAAEKRKKSGGTTSLSEVLSVKVHGNWAVARVRDPDDTVREIPFAEEGNQLWGASSLEVVDPELIENPPQGPGHDYSDPRDVSERELIKEVLYDVEGDFPLGLANSVCFELTTTGRQEIGGGLETCEVRLPKITRRALLRGYQPHFSQFRSIEIDGRQAVATVRSFGQGTRRVRFVKTAEGWKLPSVRYAGNVDPLLLREAIDKSSAFGVAHEKPAHDLGDPVGGGPKVEIREVVSDIQLDFAEGIGGVCPELSKGGERELTGQRNPVLSDCTTVASRLSRQVRRHRAVEPWHSRFISITVKGKKATAVLATPGRGRHKAHFVDQRIVGWRLVSLRQVEPVGRFLDR